MNPEDLLAQIRDLLQQYLDLGPDTPVAAEADALAAAIDANSGGGDQGVVPGEPDPLEAGLNMGAGMAPEEMPMEEPPPNTGAKTFAEANKTAEERLRRRNR